VCAAARLSPGISSEHARADQPPPITLDAASGWSAQLAKQDCARSREQVASANAPRSQPIRVGQMPADLEIRPQRCPSI
jgi:hypothetical protein